VVHKEIPLHQENSDGRRFEKKIMNEFSREVLGGPVSHCASGWTVLHWRWHCHCPRCRRSIRQGQLVVCCISFVVYVPEFLLPIGLPKGRDLRLVAACPPVGGRSSELIDS
jgi:hypothetical protein